MLNFPKISVVTPSYNQGKYIRETIDSVLSQSYPNLEYIIIDGGSTDDTVSIIDEYKDQIDYFISEPDRGQSHAINKGFEQATGDILCWLNSDDQYAPDALLSVALAFMKSSADMVAGICEVYEDGELVHRHLTSCDDGELPLSDLLDLDNGWNAGQFFYQPEVFFTRDLWIKAGGNVREDCFYSMDYELWCRFALNRASIQVIGTPLVYFRSHSEQKTADPEKFKKELIEVRDQFCITNKIDFKKGFRPPVDWVKKLKIAFVNDLGFLYGAGIAHLRLAGACELAGHQVRKFDLLTYGNPDDYTRILQDIDDFNPDIIVFGNLHAHSSSDTSLIQDLEKKYNSFWVTHDFWLLTGRCAYFSNCTKYLDSCDAQCPTADEYPVLEHANINSAFKNKRSLLHSASNLNFWVNSEWSRKVVASSLAASESTVGVHRIVLGSPPEKFKPMDQLGCRDKLGIEADRFVIAFSVSSLSDDRKGGDLLFKALEALDTSKITLLLIGRLDQEVDSKGAELISLGYVKDASKMVTALNAADIYVGPSREETFGQVFIEAAMCGVPSVGFAGSGVDSAIADGITGKLVDKFDPGALAETIQRLMVDEPLREEIVRTAPAYARGHFSLEKSFHSMFCSWNHLGLIDRTGVAHKIAFAKNSKLIHGTMKSFSDMGAFERLNYLMSRLASRVTDRLPREYRSWVGSLLPTKVKIRLMRWVMGNPNL